MFNASRKIPTTHTIKIIMTGVSSDVSVVAETVSSAGNRSEIEQQVT